jgi:hypothetical protein
LYNTPDVELEYFGDRRSFTIPSKDTISGKYIIDYGYVDLTKVGRQLAGISGAEPVEGFFDFLESEWAKKQILRKP